MELPTRFSLLPSGLVLRRKGGDWKVWEDGAWVEIRSDMGLTGDSLDASTVLTEEEAKARTSAARNHRQP